MRTRLRLMELNRAVCLECPEFQVPWFHERYCEQLQKKCKRTFVRFWCGGRWVLKSNPSNLFPGNGSISPVQKQIHKMLGEVLGGINFVRVAVATPYFYTVGKSYGDSES